MKKIISSALIFALLLTSTVSFAFSDVGTTHWAEKYIERLTTDGVIDGYEDGTFRPEGLVTKAELAKLVWASFEPEGETGSFSDVSSHWAYEYITKCAKLFYAPSSVFLPDLPASRAEVAYVLANVLSLRAAENVTFPDWDTVADAMKDKVASAVEAGLIEGYEDGTIRGDGFVTRAECAALLVRAKDYKAPEAEIPEEKPEDKPEEKPEEKPGDETHQPSDKEHLYTLHPLKDLLLIREATTAVDTNGDEVRKITYSIAGEWENVYTSSLPLDADISVAGTKTSIASLAPGDVFFVDTAFLGHISTIAVVASFGIDVPEASIPVALSYGSDGQCEFLAGTVTSRKNEKNFVVVGVDDGTEVREIDVRKTTPVFVASEKGDKHHWVSDTPGAIEEGSFVLVRLYDDDVTEVIVK